MNYESLGKELKTLACLEMYSAIYRIVMAAPKNRRTSLIRAAGFFKASDLAKEHGFSRQYAHKLLTKDQAKIAGRDFVKLEIDNSKWWYSRPEFFKS